MRAIKVLIRGTAPLVQNKFSAKARAQMMENMSTPKSQRKGKDARAPRDFDSDFENAQHISTEGWAGLPAPAFRAGMIDACRAANIVMTRTKMAVFVQHDGIDRDDGTPLVRLIAGEPLRHEGLARNDSGVADIRVRPMWEKWEALVCLIFDAGMISESSVVNLLARMGRQVGIGEGRPFSKNSVGMGWGTFEIISSEE
jgi:hypothetical protein